MIREMQAVTPKKRISAVDLRARVPAIARGLALFLLIGGAIFVGLSYYKMRTNTPFRLKSEAPALSKEITGIINGYERRITKDDRLYRWLRAALLSEFIARRVRHTRYVARSSIDTCR